MVSAAKGNYSRHPGGPAQSQPPKNQRDKFATKPRHQRDKTAKLARHQREISAKKYLIEIFILVI
jgi:hypothetical protein